MQYATLSRRGRRRRKADDRQPLSVDDASELPVLARDVKPGGTTIRSTFATENGSSARTAHSSRGARSKILRLSALGAGPRAAPPAPLPPRRTARPAFPPAVHAADRDSDATAHAAVSGPGRCCDTSGRPASDANAELPLDTRCCSSGTADGTAQTVVRTLSRGNNAAEAAASNCSATPLALGRVLMDAEMGPRE